MRDIGNPLLPHAFIFFQGLRHGIKIRSQLPQFIPGLDLDAGIKLTRRQGLGAGRQFADGCQ